MNCTPKWCKLSIKICDDRDEPKNIDRKIEALLPSHFKIKASFRSALKLSDHLGINPQVDFFISCFASLLELREMGREYVQYLSMTQAEAVSQDRSRLVV